MTAKAFASDGPSTDLSAFAAICAAGDSSLVITASEACQPSQLTRDGLDCYAIGDFITAAELFRRVVEATPNAPLAWNNLSLPLRALGQLDQAISVLQHSLDLDPAQPGIWTSYASVLMQSGKSQEAEAASLQAVAQNSWDATPWEICALARAGCANFAGAAEAFARVIDIAGETAILRANLGTMLFRCGQFGEAVSNFTRAITLDPTSNATDEMNHLCRLVLATLENDIAAAWSICAEQPAGVDQKLATMLKTALLYLDNSGHRDAALRVAKIWVQSQPDNIEARHLCDAAGARQSDRWPAELLVQHFDGLAEDFEDKLVGRLEYAGPKQIERLIESHIPRRPTLDVLDLGCGTGLLGPSLRRFARLLVGVDLSPRMIDKAQACGAYDRLNITDMMLALAMERQGWDLVVAADAFPYFGPLASVFSEVAEALRPGGWFVFSTETVEGNDFMLRGSGRYAHSRGYVTTLAAEHFQIAECFRTVLRREGGKPLEGDYFLLRRNCK